MCRSWGSRRLEERQSMEEMNMGLSIRKISKIMKKMVKMKTMKTIGKTSKMVKWTPKTTVSIELGSLGSPKFVPLEDKLMNKILKVTKINFLGKIRGLEDPISEMATAIEQDLKTQPAPTTAAKKTTTHLAAASAC